MILFCDTSALVKLYVQEDSSEVMKAAAESAAALAVCRIAWAEMMAALARRGRENPVDSAVIDAVRNRLRNDWDDYIVMEITQSLVELAGDYADTFALRGDDSVQLAAARLLHEASAEDIQFACFDARLNKAAKVLGLLPLRVPPLAGVEGSLAQARDVVFDVLGFEGGLDFNHHDLFAVGGDDVEFKVPAVRALALEPGGGDGDGDAAGGQQFDQVALDQRLYQFPPFR